MERLKSICKKAFFLPIWATVIIAVPSFVFVAIALANQSKVFDAAKYAAYILSAYALIISITAAVRCIREFKATGRQRVNSLKAVKAVRSTAIGARLLDNSDFRVFLSMHASLAINLVYAVTNGYTGIKNSSAWSISLAGYYITLSVMRSVLVRYSHRKNTNKDMALEYRYYRVVGIILLVLNQALAAMVVYMTYKNKGSVYSGLMIYWMATYTFYSTISAIVNVIKYRKKNSPVLSAAKVISLTASLVSMLSLETAMIGAFGKEDKSNFRQTMVGASGGAVCVTVLAMAIFMIVKSTKYLNTEKDKALYE